jgi:hypothetical protein
MPVTICESIEIMFVPVFDLTVEHLANSCSFRRIGLITRAAEKGCQQ